MKKSFSKFTVALMLGIFVASSSFVSSIVLAEEQQDTQQTQQAGTEQTQQAPSSDEHSEHSNEHGGHH